MDYKHLDNYVKLGLNIAYYRGLKNKTQQEIAEAIGVDVTHISRVERGNVGVSLDKLFDIANFLEVKSYKFLQFRD